MIEADGWQHVRTKGSHRQNNGLRLDNEPLPTPSSKAVLLDVA